MSVVGCTPEFLTGQRRAAGNSGDSTKKSRKVSKEFRAESRGRSRSNLPHYVHYAGTGETVIPLLGLRQQSSQFLLAESVEKLFQSLKVGPPTDLVEVVMSGAGNKVP